MNPSVDVDAKLIRGVKAGDEHALGEFYDRWFPVVNGLITRVLQSPVDVDDVVEETFWQAWRQAERFDPTHGSVQTWLLTLARSRALDRLRSAHLKGKESTAKPAQLPTDPFLAAEHVERQRMVLAALADLPQEQRETLELGYFGGLTQTEIAERTSLPVGTIKTRMRLAILKVRDRLSQPREGPR